MSKVGLKETLSLLAAGYKKKDIEALAAIDEEQEKETPPPDPAPAPDPAPTPDPVPENKEDDKDPEPDYKTMYEELLKKNQEMENKINKIQQDNKHKDSAPGAADAKAKEAESLTNLVRSFM